MGDAAAIEQHYQYSTDLLSQSTLIDTLYRNYLVQARLKAIDGDLDAALDRLNEAQRVYVDTPIPNTRPVEALRACIFIKQGQLAKARNWVRERGLSVDDEIQYLNEFEHLTLARVLIAEYRRKPEELFISDAFDLLGRLITAAEEVNRTGSIIEILIVQALAYEAQAEITSALEPLKQALKLAATEGYLRIFVDEGPPMVRLLYEALSNGIDEDYVRRLLKATPDDKLEQTDIQARQSELIEPLSEREIEVLQLIAEGSTNQEIANQLYLSLHTVKIHARNIYAKLGVKNRTQAVNKGKAVGILMN
jgi:LuxR family maltose regulon positive regulatory protein